MSYGQSFRRRARRPSMEDARSHIFTGGHSGGDLARQLMCVSPNTSASETESDFDTKFTRIFGARDPRKSAVGDPIGTPTPEYAPKPDTIFDASSPLFVKEPVRPPVPSASMLTQVLMPTELTVSIRRNAHSFDIGRSQPGSAKHSEERQGTTSESTKHANTHAKKPRHRRSSSLQHNDWPKKSEAQVITEKPKLIPLSKLQKLEDSSHITVQNETVVQSTESTVGMKLSPADSSQPLDDDNDDDYYDPTSYAADIAGLSKITDIGAASETDVVDEGRIWQVTQMMQGATVGDIIRGVVRLCNMKGGSYNLARPYRTMKRRVSGTVSSDTDTCSRRSVLLTTPGVTDREVVATDLGDGQLLLPHGVKEDTLRMDAITSASHPSSAHTTPERPAQTAADKQLPAMFELRAVDDGRPDLDVPELDRMQTLESTGEEDFALCRTRNHEHVLELHVEPGKSSRGTAVLIISFRRPCRSGFSSSESAVSSDIRSSQSRHKKVAARLRQQERLLKERPDDIDDAEPAAKSDDTNTTGEDISFDEWYRREYGENSEEITEQSSEQLVSVDLATFTASQPVEETTTAAVETNGDAVMPEDRKRGGFGLTLPFWSGKAPLPKTTSSTTATAAAAAAEHDDEYAGDVEDAPARSTRPRTKRKWDASALLRSPHVFFFGGRDASEHSDADTTPKPAPQADAAVSAASSELPPPVPAHASRGMSLMSAFTVFSPSARKVTKTSAAVGENLSAGSTEATTAATTTTAAPAQHNTPSKAKGYFSGFWTPLKRVAPPKVPESNSQSVVAENDVTDVDVTAEERKPLE